MTRQVAAGSGIIAVAAVVIGGGLLAVVGQADAAALCLLGILYAALHVVVRRTVRERSEAHFLIWVLLSSIAIRLAFALVQDYIWPDVGRMLQADARAAHLWGRELAAHWRMGLSQPSVPQDLSQLHDWFHLHRSAGLFFLFGYSPLLPEVTNIALSTSCALAGYLVVRRWSSDRAARIAALLIAFWPSIMVWSTHNLKDPVNMAALSWSTCGLLLLRDRPTPHAAIMTLLGWTLGFLIRPYMGVLMVAGQLAGWGLVAMKPRTAAGRLGSIFITVALAGMSFTVGASQIKQMYGEAVSLQYAEEKRQTFYEGAVDSRAQGQTHSEYVVDLRATSTAGIILQLPLRIPLFLLSPIPAKLGSLRLMATYPEMLFLYWLIPRFILGLGYVWRRHRAEAIFVLCSIAPICVVFSIGTSIAGEAMRYRDVILPALLLFAAVGWALKRGAREQRGLPPIASEPRPPHVGTVVR